MPPKTKKDQQEEAKRLEEEQRKREEEETKLALQKLKYATQTISTGLSLPVSNQLLIELTSRPISFIMQKLTESLTAAYPQLSSQPQLLQLVLKEVGYYMVEGIAMFNLKQIKQITANEKQLLKARIFVGISVKLMLNQHKQLGGNGKNKLEDEKLLKQLLALHVQAGENRLKIFNFSEVQLILTSLRKSYFGHFLLLFNHNKFAKRQDTEQSQIYISSPSVFGNRKDTVFMDLSQKKEVKLQSSS